MANVSNSAPIALFVYNRPEHTRKTLDLLANNIGARQSDLLIFSDGPKSNRDVAQVSAVRNLIAQAKGFRSVKVRESSENRGLAASVIAGVTAATNEYGQIIIMEDDIATSPFFLAFMNDALSLYRDDKIVGSISGYMFPVPDTLPETFFMADASCWGWATWKRAWQKFEADGRKLLHEIQRTGRLQEFDLRAAYPFCRMLEDQIAGHNNSWAIRWRASLFVNRMISLYPGVSLTKNTGTDDSGTHATSADTFFETNMRQTRVQVIRLPLEENVSARRALRSYYLKHTGYSLWSRGRRKLRNMLSRQV